MVDNTHLLDADSSPTVLQKPGIKRVNKLPIFIVLGAFFIFTLLIGMVAFKRANMQNPTATEKPKLRASAQDTNTMVNEILVHQTSGVIPDEMRVKPISHAISLPVALVDNPNLPPVPVDKMPAAPINAEMERIRNDKIQAFEEAVKASTNIAYKRPVSALNNGYKTNAQAASFKAKLQALQEKKLLNKASQFLGQDETQDRFRLKSRMEKPLTPFELKAPSVIPALMVGKIQSELPGQIIGQVSEDVYDSATGKYLLVPQGAKLLGMYSSEIVYGQSALLVAWQRITFPDGRTLDIGAMSGADAMGASGFRDEVNNHYLRTFGSAVLMSAIVGGITYSQIKNQPQGPFTIPTASNVMSEALGQQLGQVTAQMIAKNLNVAPDLKIRAGYRFNVMVAKDLIFERPYQAFSY